MDQAISIQEARILSDRKYTLKEITFSPEEGPGAGVQQSREVYFRKNSAAVLLYDPENRSVILTRQFRLPTYLNGNTSGMMIECCAGVMEDGESAEDCIRREAVEETGYRIDSLEKVFAAYMSPAAVTELIHGFTAPCSPAQKESEGGGLAEEKEYIDVIRLPFAAAYAMTATGEICDAKTILLLQHLKLKGW